LSQKVQKLNSAIDDQKKIREDSEEQLVQLLKEMMMKIKEQI
jgi:cell division protein FtsL